MEVGPTDALHDGRHPGRRGDRRDDAQRPVRGRRGRRGHARREPPGRQLAVGPAGLRPARWSRGGSVSRRTGRCRRSTMSTSSWRGRSCTTRSRGAPARTRTGCTRTCARRCSRWSASSGPRRTWTTALERIAELRERATDLARQRTARLQPRLGPRLRAAQHADRRGGRHPRRAGPHREPRSPQPPRPPGDAIPTWEHLNVIVCPEGDEMQRRDDADHRAARRATRAGRDRRQGLGARSRPMTEAILWVFRGE